MYDTFSEIIVCKYGWFSRVDVLISYSFETLVLLSRLHIRMLPREMLLEDYHLMAFCQRYICTLLQDSNSSIFILEQYSEFCSYFFWFVFSNHYLIFLKNVFAVGSHDPHKPNF